MEVVESVNVHDDIKIGLPSRDKYIEKLQADLAQPCQIWCEGGDV